MNRWFFVFPVVLGVGFVSCAFDAITGKGPLVSQIRAIDNFTCIEAGHAFRITVKQGKQYKVVVRARTNIIPYLVVRRRGTTLWLSLKPGYTYLRTGCEAEIILPSLERLKLTGASHAALDGLIIQKILSLDLSGASRLKGKIQAGTVSLGLSGASRINADLEASDIKASLSGASSAALRGRGSRFSMELSGASRFRGAGFVSAVVDAKLSGASRADIHVTERLNARLTGASGLRYTGGGKPGIISSTGASRIRKFTR